MPAKLIHNNLIGAYVYTIIVDGVVRYIGKGRRYRATEHFRFAREINRRRGCGEKVRAYPFHNKLAKAFREGLKVVYEITANGLSDADAYAREVEEIQKYPSEQLWNLHSGGSGGDAAMMRRFWADPEYRDRTVKNAVAAKRTPEYRERARATAQAHWDNPDYYSRQVAREKSLWSSPNYRAKRIAILKKVWADPEKSARKSALVKSQWSQERRAAQKARTKAEWADPAFKVKTMAKLIAAKRTPEARAEASKRMLAIWAARKHGRSKNDMPVFAE